MAKQNALELRRTEILNITLIAARAHLRTPIHTERRNMAAREMLLHRIRAEFEEMPGLSVTLEQATRLFGLTSEVSSRILRGLIEDGMLRLADGRYIIRGHEC